jgi:hypothetical protein
LHALLLLLSRKRLLRSSSSCDPHFPPSLVFILGGTYGVGWLVYGTSTPPYFYQQLPLPAVLHGVLVWPFIGD